MAVLRQKTCAPPAGRPKLLSLPPSRAFLLCQAIFRRQTSVVRAPDLRWLSVLFPSPFRADQSVPSIPYNFSPFLFSSSSSSFFTAAGTTSSPPTPATPYLSVFRRCCHERVRKVKKKKKKKLATRQIWNLHIIFLMKSTQSIWGVLIMGSVSAAWVSSTHLLKSTFRTVHVVIVHADNSTTSSETHKDDVRNRGLFRFVNTRENPPHCPEKWRESENLRRCPAKTMAGWRDFHNFLRLFFSCCPAGGADGGRVHVRRVFLQYVDHDGLDVPLPAALRHLLPV